MSNDELEVAGNGKAGGDVPPEGPSLPRESSPPAILAPGYHAAVPMAHYVSDAISPEPSLSTGIICALDERSALHAWQAHPRLGGGEGEASKRGEIGSAVHSIVLGGQTIEYVEQVTRRSGKDKGVPFVPEDWATTDAKEARDAIRARGNLPMLPHQRPVIETAAQNLQQALERFGPGRTEVTMLWQDGGVWCRGRVDYLTDDGGYDVDVKTCDNAEQAAWARSTLLGGGYDVQAALRLRGHEILGGRTRDFVFVLVELEPPYAVSCVGVSPALRAFGDRKVGRALPIWRRCLDTGKWPSYREDIYWAEPPAWAEAQYAMREAGL